MRRIPTSSLRKWNLWEVVFVSFVIRQVWGSWFWRKLHRRAFAETVFRGWGIGGSIWRSWHRGRGRREQKVWEDGCGCWFRLFLNSLGPSSHHFLLVDCTEAVPHPHGASQVGWTFSSFITWCNFAPCAKVHEFSLDCVAFKFCNVEFPLNVSALETITHRAWLLLSPEANCSVCFERAIEVVCYGFLGFRVSYFGNFKGNLCGT